MCVRTSKGDAVPNSLPSAAWHGGYLQPQLGKRNGSDNRDRNARNEQYARLQSTWRGRLWLGQWQLVHWVECLGAQLKHLPRSEVRRYPTGIYSTHVWTLGGRVRPHCPSPSLRLQCRHQYHPGSVANSFVLNMLTTVRWLHSNPDVTCYKVGEKHRGSKRGPVPFRRVRHVGCQRGSVVAGPLGRRCSPVPRCKQRQRQHQARPKKVYQNQCSAKTFLCVLCRIWPRFYRL